MATIPVTVPPYGLLLPDTLAISIAGRAASGFARLIIADVIMCFSATYNDFR